MQKRNPFQWLGLALLAAVWVSGCAYQPISEALRKEARKNLSFPVVLENPEAYRGSIVIWGGQIIQTIPQDQKSEILVLETPLGGDEKPLDDTHSQGRFIVQSDQFLDPEVYRKGRKITVAGEITGAETKAINNVPYRYPMIQAREIYIWPKSPQVIYVPYYDSFYWYNRGWWGPPFYPY